MSEIKFKIASRTVQDIANLFQNGQLNLSPGFQRSSVWQMRDREKLIESILRGYPIPGIFLYSRHDSGELCYDVIDGKQRIESLLMFMGQIHGQRFSTSA